METIVIETAPAGREAAAPSIDEARLDEFVGKVIGDVGGAFDGLHR